MSSYFFESSEKISKCSEVSDKYFTGFSETSFSWIFLVFPHRLIMSFDIRRKIVGPVVFRDEVEVGDRSWVKGSKDGVFSGVTNGCRGKAIHEIGIIRGGPQQIFLGQISIEIFDSIDHCGIALKGDSSFLNDCGKRLR